MKFSVINRVSSSRNAFFDKFGGLLITARSVFLPAICNKIIMCSKDSLKIYAISHRLTYTYGMVYVKLNWHRRRVRRMT